MTNTVRGVVVVAAVVFTVACKGSPLKPSPNPDPSVRATMAVKLYEGRVTSPGQVLPEVPLVDGVFTLHCGPVTYLGCSESREYHLKFFIYHPGIPGRKISGKRDSVQVAGPLPRNLFIPPSRDFGEYDEGGNSSPMGFGMGVHSDWPGTWRLDVQFLEKGIEPPTEMNTVIFFEVK